jgi:hypothetical protein
MNNNRIVDLHGMTWLEALPAFIEFYNNAVARGDKARLEIIHGYGSTGEGGVLRKRLHGFLEGRAGSLEVHTDNNPGHTFITPKAALPDTVDMLCEEILAYCDTPKPQSKIIGKFRRSGQPEVLGAIRTLESQRRLTTRLKGKLKVYEAV